MIPVRFGEGGGGGYHWGGGVGEPRTGIIYTLNHIIGILL